MKLTMWRKWLIRVVVVALGFHLLMTAWLYFMLPNMLFYPVTDHIASPQQWELPYQDVEIASGKEKLHGWFFPAGKDSPVILFFHGNGGNISYRGDTIYLLNKLGMNLLMIDYRGYGHSTGSPSEQGLYEDARAAWQYLLQQRGYKPSQVIIFGRSMGGAVATQLASEVKAAGLILESTFSSLRDMAEYYYPDMHYLMYLRYRFDSATSIQQVSCPVLMVHSPEDEIVPYQLGVKLYQNIAGEKYFLEINGDHNNGFMESLSMYAPTLKQFFNQVSQ